MATMAKKSMGFIVGAVLSIYAFVYVGVPAITELFNADTAAWDSGAASLLAILPIFIMLAIAVMYAQPALDRL